MALFTRCARATWVITHANDREVNGYMLESTNRISLGCYTHNVSCTRVENTDVLSWFSYKYLWRRCSYNCIVDTWAGQTIMLGHQRLITRCWQGVVSCSVLEVNWLSGSPNSQMLPCESILNCGTFLDIKLAYFHITLVAVNSRFQ